MEILLIDEFLKTNKKFLYEIIKNYYTVQMLVPLDYNKNKSPNSTVSSKSV